MTFNASDTSSNPAIVAQNAVRRLPRWVLLTFCLAYVLPGFVGRTPWKADDMEAFGYMLHLAQAYGPESVSWLKPSLLEQADPLAALLPYWLGAWSIQIMPAAIPIDLAARMPFMGLLALSLAATWYGVYALARTPAAQPVTFAFGGEARPADYARAIADGGLLALLACLGLARLSHEATPALAQLSFSALLFFALANLPRKRTGAWVSSALAIVGMALSGAPALAMILGVGGAFVMALDTGKPSALRARSVDVAWVLLICLATAALVSALGLWRWRVAYSHLVEIKSMTRLLLWFTWPAWPLALWTLWRWRFQLKHLTANPHLSLPLWFVTVAICTTWLSGLSDRALLLSLPAMATLAAFALPTLRRSVSAFVDWFTLVFFSVGALIIWVVWTSMQTGVPAQPAINVARLAPGFTHAFSGLAFACAVMATLVWASLVKWRAGRHRAAIWKSMALPAGGAILCWLLVMTLWLPLLNFARSYEPLVLKVRDMIGSPHCVHYHGLTRAQGAAFEFHGQFKLQPSNQDVGNLNSQSASCDWLIVDTQAMGTLKQDVDMGPWQYQATVRRPSDNNEDIVLYKRTAPTVAKP
ncbi:MAG: hypothetical protein EB085_07045 [Betaproteobacteria bacterium]|nr:hypothetical protein [Betaproteobacteria bacterium]NDD01879.1 hypothetical protein [Betaproteobacteria bacterium]